ncbi:LacI family transcriptional regulator [Paraoerskovia sediminicola]|uniref:LacI family transcriptional regulator n=1 Tax=Paraoerskovia sediminicola TaxID=1138587 RepID=A0ABM8G2D0_9CELL|nr:LacI family DNA-binding transcriptional regulator [Paraoerskovia sediminicola]BDZ42136.1 LacI family transcriptional regulator [Paraoerskovia sediminicola]
MAETASAGKPPRARARLVDVAELSGVTKSVVSRTLNNDPTLRARPETRERVLAAARQLGYRPHAGARALSVARTGTFAFLIPDLTNSVYAVILRGAIRRARELGYVVLIAEDARQSPAGAEEYAELVDAGRVDGLLVASARPDSPLIAALVAQPDSVPHVYVNREVPGSDRNVGMDIRGASVLAVEYLAGFGHSRIGFVSGPRGLHPAVARGEGFAAAMSGLGLAGDLVASGEFDEEGGFEATHDLLTRAPDVTALYVSTLGQAIGALAAARAVGRSIPDDLSVICYDDVPMADYLSPSLTTISMPLDALGVAAVDALMAQVSGEPARRVSIADHFAVVPRDSVAPPATHA